VAVVAVVQVVLVVKWTITSDLLVIIRNNRSILLPFCNANSCQGYVLIGIKPLANGVQAGENRSWSVASASYVGQYSTKK